MPATSCPGRPFFSGEQAPRERENRIRDPGLTGAQTRDDFESFILTKAAQQLADQD